MWRMWLLFDPRRTLVALFTFLFVSGPRHPLHPAVYGSFQLVGRSAQGCSDGYRDNGDGRLTADSHFLRAGRVTALPADTLKFQGEASHGNAEF